jgi:hypothetical protein
MHVELFIVIRHLAACYSGRGLLYAMCGMTSWVAVLLCVHM